MAAGLQFPLRPADLRVAGLRSAKTTRQTVRIGGRSRVVVRKPG
jgi:hypothetical protein